ncbi:MULTISPECIES: DUF72 domain-containing protein [Pontibacillus]|uniref:DUF72 domain-containing protein n=1 Tax=Pontibacillus chungwhensis TaxID=265426 RepID=A0ABY8US46_9BACI|nr:MULTISPECIES: DUF72 domain-containing protein [Pontibacillus]MCD5322928.1 DUF72 domain-containing protein [Pontibacillus sp. HN14]WIF96322.1 DUF72 domain-containing protein [Pontibacillus chungwhensis]
MMNVSIGVTGWGDHDQLYPTGTKNHEKLSAYASHFPVVEIDSAFYAIQPRRNYEKWVKETPDGFSFVVKAYNKMTGHHKEKLSSEEVRDMFIAYKDSIQPLVDAGKLRFVLFQFPPWFSVSKENVQKLRVIRELMGDLPVALEFRNQTWYSSSYREQTLSFMDENNWIHGVVDEPQAGEGSAPTVLRATHSEETLVRLHGRNVHGWNKNGREDWREVRFLYRYNEEELSEWKRNVKTLLEQCEHVTVLFNNNSGGDAADNAKQFIDLCEVNYDNLNPRQMDLFQD